jgi:hypothetical protein
MSTHRGDPLFAVEGGVIAVGNEYNDLLNTIGVSRTYSTSVRMSRIPSCEPSCKFHKRSMLAPSQLHTGAAADYRLGLCEGKSQAASGGQVPQLPAEQWRRYAASGRPSRFTLQCKHAHCQQQRKRHNPKRWDEQTAVCACTQPDKV